ncbi:MAG: hypothetical protein J6Y54_09350 [Lentisphaeria bacterium]|jgi:DNA-binding IclR family transcriptional regulator|nr:hypothetical protein [Lentisphaeria bacterium]
MIQVIERAVKIMEELALDGEVPLESMVRLHGLNKGTLCNILRALIDMKWVEKCGRGNYRLSDHFRELCNTPEWDKHGIELMQQAATDLSLELRESTVISTLRRRRLVVMAQAQYQRELMINQVIFYGKLSLYSSVSGRVICACLPPAERKAIYKQCAPLDGELRGVNDLEGYEAELARVREAGISIMTNRTLGIKSFAVPVIDSSGAVCASFGLTMPLSRLPADNGEGIAAALRRANHLLMRKLALGGFSAGNFIR